MFNIVKKSGEHIQAKELSIGYTVWKQNGDNYIKWDNVKQARKLISLLNDGVKRDTFVLSSADSYDFDYASFIYDTDTNTLYVE